MQVKGREHVIREVTLDVDPNEALKSIIGIVYQNLDLPTHTRLFIEDGVIVSYEDEQYGSHSSVERKVRVEKPSALQLEAITHFNAIERIVANNSVVF